MVQLLDLLGLIHSFRDPLNPKLFPRVSFLHEVFKEGLVVLDQIGEGISLDFVEY